MDNPLNPTLETQIPATATTPPSKPATSKSRWLVGIVVLLAMGIGLPLSGLLSAKNTQADQKLLVDTTVSKPMLVKTVKPKLADSIPITIDQIAQVEPYYRADLRARASGLVKRVYHDIGEKVREGEILIEIDVPESEQEVAKCQAQILQREQELKVSYAKLKDAKAARDVSAATIKQRKADVEAAQATRDLKKRKFARFQELAQRGSVVGSLVEEEERDYLSSEAAVTSTLANVERANADFAESESKIEAAEADIELKKAQIVVAQKELERARAVADYAKIRAPFDGVVIRRSVDPGSFVQNATTGNSDTLISIAKVDLITVSAKFPDAVAPSIHVGTTAQVQIDDMAGLSIQTKVTRIAPSVQNSDRTMRVEVDLFNGDEQEYRRLKEGMNTISQDTLLVKSTGMEIPQRVFQESNPANRLLPGMTATMRLSIGGYNHSYVVPSTAIYSRSGKSYIMVVEEGITRQLPVKVQLNDLKVARVVLMQKRANAEGTSIEISAELTGKEEVMIARQLEVGPDAKVTSGLSEW